MTRRRGKRDKQGQASKIVIGITGGVEPDEEHIRVSDLFHLFLEAYLSAH